MDLADFAGEAVTLSLSATSEQDGTIAFWGAPAVRPRAAGDASGGPAADRHPHPGRHAAKGPPRRLRLRAARRRPTLNRLAEEGALFDNAITQTSWTKAATPSIMTSLYPSTHGVHQIPDRLPASATTIAEVFREAGYATASFSSVGFTGAFTNLHQGFEELHEAESTVGRAGPPEGRQDRARVRGPAHRVARRPPRRAVLRLPALLRSALALRAQPALRHDVGRSQGARGVPARSRRR